ncbi:MAG: protein jag, partial [Poseidonibacter sp.]
RKNDTPCCSEKVETKVNKISKTESKDKIFDNFYNEEKSQTEISNIIIKKDKEQIVKEVKADIDLLFSNTCYEIDNIKVEFCEEDTLYVEFTGEDCALLIGKEGYRYKALSYILFNWINEKYGLMLRLEVAEFLKNQEASIYAYLEPVIEVIKEKGTFKTKPLDGILVHIALKRLREEFPNKYVAVKTNVRGDKYVLVNEYRSKEQ